MDARPIAIRLVKVRGRTRALKFISDRFKKKFGSDPVPPEMIFAGYQGREVIATLSVDLAAHDRPFPWEHVFDHDPSLLPFQITRENSIQFGRWASVLPQASIPLIFAATHHSIESGKQYGWCVVKSDARDKLRSLGFTLHEIPKARLAEDRIMPQDKQYYSTPPLPELYVMELGQMSSVLRFACTELVKKKIVTFEFDLSVHP